MNGGCKTCKHMGKYPGSRDIEFGSIFVGKISEMMPCCKYVIRTRFDPFYGETDVVIGDNYQTYNATGECPYYTEKEAT